MLLSGLGIAAVAAIVVTGAAIGRDDEDDRTAQRRQLPHRQRGQTSITTPLRTEAPQGTEAAETEATEAETAGTEEAAGGTARARDTTVSAPEVFELMVIPYEIWEQPANGTACGPTTLEVTFQPQTMTPLAPVVHWLVGGVNGELPMVIDGNVARATIGPFGPDTLDTGFPDAVFLYVTDSDAAGVLQRFEAPVMLVLHDCPP